MAQKTGKSMRVKNADAPDETRKFEGKGHLDVLDFGDQKVGVGTFEPGWKWSTNVKPIAKTDSCQSAHLSYIVAGRMKVVHDDGTEIEVGPGDTMQVTAGHDAWVVGNEACVQVDFMSAANYAKR